MRILDVDTRWLNDEVLFRLFSHVRNQISKRAERWKEAGKSAPKEEISLLPAGRVVFIQKNRPAHALENVCDQSSEYRPVMAIKWDENRLLREFGYWEIFPIHNLEINYVIIYGYYQILMIMKIEIGDFVKYNFEKSIPVRFWVKFFRNILYSV